MTTKVETIMTSIEDVDREALRTLVRSTLIKLLQDADGDIAANSEGPRSELRRRRAAPPDRELSLVIRGNERAVSLLEDALNAGQDSLEIGLGARWGPRVRLRARRAEPTP
ncbi:MAG: hypothetical protein QM655_07510 [Nocardioidaceae bacterium]